jgi:hypothetical protein
MKKQKRRINSSEDILSFQHERFFMVYFRKLLLGRQQRNMGRFVMQGLQRKVPNVGRGKLSVDASLKKQVIDRAIFYRAQFSARQRSSTP